MGLRKINKENLTARIYQQIKEAIMSGRFHPGERVPIRQLAEKMGTSATPVREALLKLVSFGALEMKPAHPIIIPVLDKKRYLENRAIRIVNEGLAISEAAKIITKRQLNKLHKVNDEMVKADREGRFKDFIAHNYEFHIEICRSAEMPVLLGIVEILWLQIGPSLNFLRAYAPDTRPEDSPNYHIQILQALEKNDSKAAREALENDMVKGGEKLVSYFESQEH